MEFLEYVKISTRLDQLDGQAYASQAKINLITNFTDTILKKIIAGVCLHNSIYPHIYEAPYRQYHLHLKDPRSVLYKTNPDITFIFFDVNPFKETEFGSSPDHFYETLDDIEKYCKSITGTVILNLFIRSYQNAYGILFKEDPKFALVENYNNKLHELATQVPNLKIFDTNKLVHLLGERNVFDPRSIFAFDIPFTHDFMTHLAEDWFSYIRALTGSAKKCIVVDLDNTLWGGIVGELGPLHIALGPEYPGNAFVNFQRALLEYYKRGIILAINSKNNAADVAEVFQRNPHMVLKEHHFSAIRVNWQQKTENILEIANELNIGTDSMVFIDDDPLNRHLVEAQLPQVSVPNFSIPPEEYVGSLYSLNLFNQLSITDEDREKGKMYAEERQRKRVLEGARDIKDYIAELGICIDVNINVTNLLPRLSQMTLKTNQFNLTTKRYTEHDLLGMIADGALICSANIHDKFGDYGTVILGIFVPNQIVKQEVVLDTLLMSCRVMGRGVEFVFIDHLIQELSQLGFSTLKAQFVPTKKNEPSSAFLADHGFVADVSGSGNSCGNQYFSLDIAGHLNSPRDQINRGITVRTSFNGYT